MVTKIVHQLKLLKLFRFDDHSPSMARSKSHGHVVITLPAPGKKCSMDSFPRGVPAVQFHNCSPSVNEDTARCKYVCFIQPNGVLSESYNNFMPAAYPRVQIRNLMSPDFNFIEITFLHVYSSINMLHNCSRTPFLENIYGKLLLCFVLNIKVRKF